MNVALEKLCLDKGWYLKPEAAKIAIIGDLGTKTRTTGVLQIRNIEIWEAYEFQKQRVRKDLEGRADVPAVTNGLASQVCSWMLIHGTTQDKVDEIASFGFDERLARESGLYGQGIYFTDQSCKSFQQGRPKAPFDIIQKITFNCWNLAQFFCSSLNYCLV